MGVVHFTSRVIGYVLWCQRRRRYEYLKKFLLFEQNEKSNGPTPIGPGWSPNLLNALT